MVGRKDGLMRFHKISPCPKCGGQGQGEMGGVSASVRADFQMWGMQVHVSYRNAMCNGDRKYKLIRESLGGRR